MSKMVVSKKRRSITPSTYASQKEWDDALCAICMEHPHNAVLLICSSHAKGCRPYICDTSYRHSNCFDRYRKMNPNDKQKTSLTCPLCRGDVQGWKVLEDARTFLNAKTRCCSWESCGFVGSYRELRIHARKVHPSARPAEVDRSKQREWRRLEIQREYNDVVSSLRSAMPGAVVVGDYVIEDGDGNDDGVNGAESEVFWTGRLFQMLAESRFLTGEALLGRWGPEDGSSMWPRRPWWGNQGGGGGGGYEPGAAASSSGRRRRGGDDGVEGLPLWRRRRLS